MVLMPEEVYPVELIAPDIEPYRKGNTGIEFVTSLDSGKPGPHVMINAITHGNEICGAIALDYLFKANVRPMRGKLTLAFVNHLAYSNFDPKNPGPSRFVDEDFNRVWVEERLEGLEITAELRRARELRPVFDSVDLLLDIHSMGTYSKPLMICNGLKKEREFTKKVNFPAHIMCGSGHIIGKRLIEYTPFNDDMNKKVALLVEAGQHWAKGTEIASLDTALHFLRASGIVDPNFVELHLSEEGKRPPVAEMWDVTDGVTAVTDNFKFIKPFVGMEIIPEAGTVIANDGNLEIKTSYNDCLLMMPNHRPGAGVRKLRLCKRA
jgi:predicted deacylase